jgi:hypothetical protein
MRLKITIGLAALALGAALASVPAVAQQGVSGYSSRGAAVTIHPYRHHTHTGPLYNYAPRHTLRHNDKNPGQLQNNGGM